MFYLNIEIPDYTLPSLDPSFVPIGKFNQAFLKQADENFFIGLESTNQQMAVFSTKVHSSPEMLQANCYFLRRILKTMLWLYGGFKFHLMGDQKLIDTMRGDFSSNGVHKFDVEFMSNIFEKPFEIMECFEIPIEKKNLKSIGGNLNGCRIGFDAGGSDRKVCAVIDGKCVFSEEIVWFPKKNSDPDYHFTGITDAFRAAATHLPQVDGVGISSAGIYIEDLTMSASLFLEVPTKLFDEKVKNIYPRAIKEVFGENVPFSVVNDGDVSALAGAMDLGKNNVLGMAMGTSEAVGFLDKNGYITGWLNELAFVPVDVSESAMRDEWSGDIGCGVKYFSQDAVIKLAKNGGIVLDEWLSPAEKLKKVQKLVQDDDSTAKLIFESIGVYLAHTLVFYHEFYDFESVLLLGRVMSGEGGDIILKTAQSIFKKEYPEIKFSIQLPDENARRVGQAVAAASLPKIF